MNFVILLVCSMISNFSVVNVNAQTNRIINGTVAKIGQFPYFTFLHSKKTKEICGGSIITSKWILSAAHCIAIKATAIPSEPSHIDNVTCYFGSIRMKGGVRRLSKLQLIHPKYIPFHLEYDILLLKLEKKIDYTEYIQKISLPKKWMSYENIKSFKFNIAGMGVVWNDVDTTVLRYTTFKLVSKDLCIIDGPNPVPLSKEKLCAESYFLNVSQTVCFGDSGSGLVTRVKEKLYIIGVVSYITDKNCESKKGRVVLSSVLENLDWITKTIGI